MCVIVSKPEGATLDKERAARLWQKNSDGGGFAYIADGKVQVHKEMSFKKWWKAYSKAVSDHPDAHFLIHMRIRTHGDVNVENTHPFWVDEHTVMAHNGILHGVKQAKDDKRSDTKAFVEDLLPMLPEDWLDNQFIVTMVEEWIGWSKLMFLTTNPKLQKNVYILNERANSCATVDGMWFSNTGGVHPAPVRAAHSGVGFGYSATDGIISKGKRQQAITFEEFLKEAATDEPNTEPRRIKRTLLHGPADQRKEITEYREKELAIFAPITYDYGMAGSAKSKNDPHWECLGCDERLDPKTGDCDCWETLCLVCSQLTAECLCSRGYSSNSVHYSQLDEGQLTQMLRVGEEVRKRWLDRKEAHLQPAPKPVAIGQQFNGRTGEWEPIYSRASMDTWDW